MIFMQYNVTLPLDLAARGMTPATFGFVLSANGLLVVLLQPFAGRLLGSMRRSTALAAASALTGLGFGLHGMGAHVPLALFAVTVWSIGEVLQAPVASAVVADLAPPHQRGVYQGAYATLWAGSACLSPLLGTWLLGHLGRAPLWGGCLAVGLFAATGTGRRLLSPPPHGRPAPALPRRERRARLSPTPPFLPTSARTHGCPSASLARRVIHFASSEGVLTSRHPRCPRVSMIHGTSSREPGQSPL
ncbi:MFS transporter [Cystobacter fuscus]